MENKRAFCEVSGRMQTWTHIYGSLYVCPCCGSEMLGGRVSHAGLVEAKAAKPARKKTAKPKTYGKPGPKPLVDIALGRRFARLVNAGVSIKEIMADNNLSYYEVYRGIRRSGIAVNMKCGRKTLDKNNIIS